MSAFDVVVVGSGPAGGSAARVAAEAGKKVLVLERSKGGCAADYRVKPCGGGLGPAVLRAFPELESSVVHWTRRAANYFEDEMRFDLDVSIGMTHRNELDFAIAERAMRAGAEYAFGEVVTETDLDRRRLRLASGKTIEYRDWLVGAAGAACPVARAIGYEKKCVPLVVGKVDGGAGNTSPEAELFFYDAFIGYGWNFPKRDFLDVGIGGDAPGSTVKAMLDRLLKSRGWTLYDRQAWMIPWELPERAPYDARRRVILVGDSAGLVNYMTGEGITYAARSGREAGLVIAGRMPIDAYPTFRPHLERLLRARDVLVRQPMREAFKTIFGRPELARDNVGFLFEEKPPPAPLAMSDEEKLAAWQRLANALS